jgi:hypothetical protein
MKNHGNLSNFPVEAIRVVPYKLTDYVDGKTIPRLIRALRLKAHYWIVRKGFIPEEESLCIARQYLGKHYNGKNIHTVFSKKKKHVLKYWMGDPTQ